jgi:DNA-binding response OmpR family regulator
MATRLLIIDDNPGITDMLELVLPPEGFDVTTVNNGPDGIETTQQMEPDVIILDLMMPGVDGWTVCREIRSFSQVPILILSAVVDSDEVARAMAEGASDYLVKPARLEELVAHMNRLIEAVPRPEGHS